MGFWDTFETFWIRKSRVSTSSPAVLTQVVLRKGAPVWNLVGDLLFPPSCRLCETPVGHSIDFCSPCESKLRVSESRMECACQRCGRPGVTAKSDQKLLGLHPQDADNPAEKCAYCEKETFLFDEVIPMWVYEDTVCDAVVAAKFGHQAPLADALGRLLSVRVIEATKEDPPEVVVGIPQHWTRRLIRRGNGNQALAGAVTRRLALHSAQIGGTIAPFVPILRTTRKIQKQAWLDDTARRKNVQDAFALARGYGFIKPERRLLGSHVLLIDDVLTTGATANEITGVLKKAGARRVTLAVVARAFWN